MLAPSRGGLRAAGSLSFALLAAAALAPSGCGTKPASTVTVVIASEASVGDEVDFFEIEHHHGGEEGLPQEPADPQSFKLPGTLTIYDNPSDDVKPSEPAQVIFRLSAQQLPKRSTIERAVNVAMLEDDPRMVFVTLRYACMNFTDNCLPDETCIAGRCGPATVDVESAPKLDKTKVIPKAGVDPCFDPAQGFADPIDLAPTALVASKTECFLEPPNAPAASGASRKLNVALSWDRDPTRAIPLDNEPSPFEGWAFVDENTHRIRLAPGYCDLIKPPVKSTDLRPRLTNVRISYAAPPKTQLLPLCAPPGGKMGFTITQPTQG